MSVSSIKKIFYIGIFISLSVLLIGCNQGIFVDRLEISASRLHLDSEGDSTIVQVTSSDWIVSQIQTDIKNPGVLFCKKYDASGNLINDSEPLEYLDLRADQKLIFEDEYVNFTVQRLQPNQLKIITGENLRNHDFEFQIMVSDLYGTTGVTITQQAGSGYLFDTIIYTLRPHTYTTYFAEKPPYLTIHNHTDHEIAYPVSVFSEESQMLYFSSDNRKIFSYLEDADRQIVYPHMTNASELKISGNTALFSSDKQDKPLPFDDVIKTVYIPVGSRKICRLIEYEEYEADFTLYVKNEKKRKCMRGVFHCKMPTGAYYVILRHL